METIGIIGAGDLGSEIARGAIAGGYRIVIANSRGPETLTRLVAGLGPSARAAHAREAAAAGDFVILSFPLTVADDLPVDELAGKVVLDTNNYMIWRDGHIPAVDSGEKTVHELRQEQLPRSKVAKAFTHIQHERLLSAGRPPGHPERVALAVSSDYPEAVDVVVRLYDRLGYDTVNHSPLSESWRTAPGQPAWVRAGWQSREELALNLRRADRAVRG